MREDGHGVSNERVSLLLKILKAEEGITSIGPVTAPAADEPDDRPQVAA